MNRIEVIESSFEGSGPSRRRGWSSLWTCAIGGWLVLVAIFCAFVFVWFGCRIEPGSDEIAILIRKTGKDLPSGDIIATAPGQKGIQLEVLSEGRYFRNPYTWGWKIARITDIPAGKLGVQTRLYGKDLPPGRILAEKDTKGILPETLGPGKHRLNPYAISVRLFDATSISPGHVGVVTSMTGADILTNNIPAETRNAFLVEKGRKGVLTEVLDPGTYYLNPYTVSIAQVNLQSQRFEMAGEDAIVFLTMDGFTVSVEGTVEFALHRDAAALLTHRVGDLDDILKKVILPRARGFSRIQGSKHPAIDFIVGETRQKFQNDLDGHLREQCKAWGVDIKSVLVRRIVVPDEIASISRDREMAVQDARKYDQQIAMAKSKAELVRQEMLAEQNKVKVDAETARIRAVIGAQQEQAVQLIRAGKELDVAKLKLDTATFQAEAVVRRAKGECDAIRARNEAEAGVLAARVQAVGDGMTLARLVFYQRIGPRIRSILGSTEEEGLGGLLRPYVSPRKEVSR